jgi:hypothetical protein
LNLAYTLIELTDLEENANAKLKDLKIIVTGNAKVWDVGIAEIMHWWQ